MQSIKSKEFVRNRYFYIYFLFFHKYLIAKLMGGCIKKASPSQRDSQQEASHPMYPSIEDFYQKNKYADIKTRASNTYKTSVCVLPTVPEI